MDRLTAQPLTLAPAEHGEGPTWDAGRSELLWVDITAGLVHRSALSPEGVWSQVATHAVGGTVGAVVPATAGGWLLAAGPGFTHLPEDGEARTLIELSGEGGSESAGGTRMNDAACDRAGRFFAGTMAFDERPGAGTLYCLDTDGTVRTVLDGLGISNGIDWSPDDRTVYLSDSGAATVQAFPYDLSDGTFGPGQVLLDLAGDDGPADGLTVDDEGCLWVAIWSGGQVRRYSPDGDLLTVVEVGTDNTSSCAFAGPGRDLLVISTSRHGLPDEALAAQPQAGRLFSVRPGTTGPPARPYRGPVEAIRQT